MLLSDPYQTDFINCLNRSFYFMTSEATILIHVGEGIVVDRVLGTFVSSSIKSKMELVVVICRVSSGNRGDR